MSSVKSRLSIETALLHQHNQNEQIVSSPCYSTVLQTQKESYMGFIVCFGKPEIAIQKSTIAQPGISFYPVRQFMEIQVYFGKLRVLTSQKLSNAKLLLQVLSSNLRVLDPPNYEHMLSGYTPLIAAA